MMPHSSASTTASFEFTKRKRYADLLITELSDAIVLILSATGKVYYCGTAVTELLGWGGDEWIDEHIADYIHSDDYPTFLQGFESCVCTQTELVTFVRLRRKISSPPTGYGHTQQAADSNTALFEIKGYTKHFRSTTSTDPCCVFAVAKPYPGYNAALLNTFLDLKIENQRLHERLNQLRSRPQQRLATFGGDLSGNGFFNQSYADYMPLRLNQAFDMPGSNRVGSMYGLLSSSGAGLGMRDDGDALEEQSKKRKLNKMVTNGVAQHVCFTCGRTDSPEWRKGPQGPKTLCNACGLRWAKELRKGDNGDITMEEM